MRSRSLGILGAGVLGLTALLSHGSLPRTPPSLPRPALQFKTDVSVPLSDNQPYATAFLDTNGNGLCDEKEYSTTNHTSVIYGNMTLRVMLPLSFAGKELRILVKQRAQPVYCVITSLPPRETLPLDAQKLMVLSLPLDQYKAYLEERALLNSTLPQRFDFEIGEFDERGLLFKRTHTFPLYFDFYRVFTPPAP